MAPSSTVQAEKSSCFFQPLLVVLTYCNCFALQPNCVAEVVIIEKMPKIIIISNRKLEKGEEVG